MTREFRIWWIWCRVLPRLRQLGAVPQTPSEGVPPPASPLLKTIHWCTAKPTDAVPFLDGADTHPLRRMRAAVESLCASDTQSRTVGRTAAFCGRTSGDEKPPPGTLKGRRDSYRRTGGEAKPSGNPWTVMPPGPDNSNTIARRSNATFGAIWRRPLLPVIGCCPYWATSQDQTTTSKAFQLVSEPPTGVRGSLRLRKWTASFDRHHDREKS